MDGKAAWQPFDCSGILDLDNSNWQEHANNFCKQFKEAVAKAQTEEELERLRIFSIGKNGVINIVLREHGKRMKQKADKQLPA